MSSTTYNSQPFKPAYEGDTGLETGAPGHTPIPQGAREHERVSAPAPANAVYAVPGEKPLDLYGQEGTERRTDFKGGANEPFGKPSDTFKPNDPSYKSGDAFKPNEPYKPGDAFKPNEPHKASDTFATDELNKQGGRTFEPNEPHKPASTFQSEEPYKPGHTFKPNEPGKATDTFKTDEPYKPSDTFKPNQPQVDTHKPEDATFRPEQGYMPGETYRPAGAGYGTEAVTVPGPDKGTGAEYKGSSTTSSGYADPGFGTNSEGNIVLTVDSPDLKTIRISGGGMGYTLRTTWEHHNELVTIHRDDDGAGDVTTGAGTGITGAGTGMTGTRTGMTGTGTGMTGTGASGMKDETAPATAGGEPFVAQVEVHQIRSSKLSLKGGPQIKLKDWLSGRGTGVHKFEDGGATFEWRRSISGLHHKLELFETANPDTCIARAEKTPTPTQSTTNTNEPREPGKPPMPSMGAAAKAELTLTPRAMKMVDTVVVSFLLVDRESRGDPLH